MKKLSAVIITHNEEYNIGRCLASLQGLADEMIVVDAHSSDQTAAICASYGCKILQKPFTGFSEQKQFAVDHASNDWVFSLDADEEVTPELKKEIFDFLNEEGSRVTGCFILRDLVYLGKHMKFGGTSGERILRIFDRKAGAFDGAVVHEKVRVEGATRTLRGKLLHYSYRDLGHHVVKINAYTQKIAEDHVRKGKTFPKIWAILKPTVTFFTIFLLKGGLFDGYAGWIWSRMGSLYAALKISKTIELTKKAAG